ncbi:MAG: hypothetical protein V4576_04375 [Patescibacteria group bacterium]
MKKDKLLKKSKSTLQFEFYKALFDFSTKSPKERNVTPEQLESMRAESGASCTADDLGQVAMLEKTRDAFTGLLQNIVGAAYRDMANHTDEGLEFVKTFLHPWLVGARYHYAWSIKVNLSESPMRHLHSIFLVASSEDLFRILTYREEGGALVEQDVGNPLAQKKENGIYKCHVKGKGSWFVISKK